MYERLVAVRSGAGNDLTPHVLVHMDQCRFEGFFGGIFWDLITKVLFEKKVLN